MTTPSLDAGGAADEGEWSDNGTLTDGSREDDDCDVNFEIASLTAFGLANTNEFAVTGSAVGVGVACERVGVVWFAAAVPGMDMTDAVSVVVEVRSSSLRCVCPTGVNALVSLFWS